MKTHWLLAAFGLATSPEAKHYVSQFVPDPLQHYPSRSSQGSVSAHAQVPDSELALARLSTRVCAMLFGKRFGIGFGNGLAYEGAPTSGPAPFVQSLDHTSTIAYGTAVIGNAKQAGLLHKGQAAPTAHDEAETESSIQFLASYRNAGGSGQPAYMAAVARIACHDLTHNGWWIGYKTPSTVHLLVAAAANQVILEKLEASSTYQVMTQYNSAGTHTVVVTPATVPAVDVEDTWEVSAEAGTKSDGSDSILVVRQNGVICQLAQTNYAAALLDIYNIGKNNKALVAGWAGVNLDGTQRAGNTFYAAWFEVD